ncbi:type II toxin-antitoxin system PemK/MazF family toxin [Pseudonocardia sp.]|uniref:type II toxin-antitoxin system PemK/MazF family toxin n=1 Tax=Pseudonocardia sp. TaxID=60912 RepID=UPI003D12D1F9
MHRIHDRRDVGEDRVDVHLGARHERPQHGGTGQGCGAQVGAAEHGGQGTCAVSADHGPPRARPRCRQTPREAGSRSAYRRPALVVSSNRFNRSRISTVLVAAVTSNLRLAAAPGNVTLPRHAGSLPKPSVVNVSQLLTVDRVTLDQRIGALDPAYVRAVDDGLRLVLGL